MRLGLKRGAGIAVAAQKEGLTVPTQSDTIGSNGNIHGIGNNLSPARSDIGIQQPISGTPNVPNGDGLPVQGTPLKTVELNALAKAKGLDINAVRKEGYSDQEIQAFLQGNNAGQVGLPTGNPNAISACNPEQEEQTIS